MTTGLYKKGMVIAIICLFLGAGVVPSISGNVEGLKDNLKFDNGSSLNCDKVHVTYSFQNPTIETIDIAGTIYNRVISPGLDPAGKTGEPLIPAKGAYVLLPPNSRVNKIEVISSKKTIVGTGLAVEPMEKPIPISEKEISSIPEPDESIYNSNSFYPGELFSQVGKYSFRGYQILVLLLYPIQYNPVSGELCYYEKLEVSIETATGGCPTELFRGLEKDKNEIFTKIDNPDDINWYDEKMVRSSSFVDEYDLLILTTDSLKDYFEPLKQTHDENGVVTVIKTLTDVGGTSPEDIRDYIRDAYTDWSIEYVLIGGDATVVPPKMLYVYGLDENVKPYETEMPSDLYYACLDGTFNFDNDRLWGEPNDGDGGSDVDLFADVYVGRACVFDDSDVSNFVTKTITYMNEKMNTDSYLKKVVLAGEYLGYHTFGSDYLDQLIGSSDEDGYSTVGIPSNKFNIEKLYDRDWPGAGSSWPEEEIIQRINSGTHIITHDGHSSFYYNMRMHWEDLDLLTNEQYCFVYSNGCYSGAFDEGCIAEYFTAKKAHGAFAGIWNARYGFYWKYRTDSDSQRYVREFWDAVFGENIHMIGKANHDSREDNLHLIDRSCMRWVYYELNLFGDPAIAFRISYPPNKPETPAGPAQGTAGEEYTYSTSSTDPDGDQLYYKWNWDDGNFSEWLGPFNSGENCETSYTWTEQNEYNITVITKDVHGEESPWSDPLPITMPKNKAINPFILFLERLIERFPILEQILQPIYGNVLI